DGAEFVLRVRGLLRLLGVGVGQLLVEGLEVLEHLPGAVDDPHRAPAPLDREHLPGLELADIHLDRGAGGTSPRAGRHARHEGHRGGRHAGEPDPGGHRRQKSPATRILAYVAHGFLERDTYSARWATACRRPSTTYSKPCDYSKSLSRAGEVLGALPVPLSARAGREWTPGGRARRFAPARRLPRRLARTRGPLPAARR